VQLRLPSSTTGQDAIAEIHHFGTRGYHWVFEADITACFDELSHCAILDRVGMRVGDKRVLALIKAFLKAGVMSETGQVRDSVTGAPQGGIASSLIANIALTVLDEHFCAKWDAHGADWRWAAHRKRGGATYKIVRYADDFVIMVNGSEAHTQALWDEVTAVLAPLGLRLSPTKSRVCHLDEGFVFLGFHIQRRRKRGTSEYNVYTYPSKKALASITAKVRTMTNRSRHKTLSDLLRQLNPALRGWCNYFQHGVSGATFRYLDQFVWNRVTRWLLKRHARITWKDLYRRFLTARPGHRPAEGNQVLFLCQKVEITRYRWRIPHPHTLDQRPSHTNRIANGNLWSAGCTETGSSGAEGGPGKRTGRNAGTAPRSDPYTKLHGPAPGIYYDLYVILDIYSRYVPGFLVAPTETGELAAAFGRCSCRVRSPTMTAPCSSTTGDPGPSGGRTTG
jgi:RNA-directed DNA polymerase